MSTQLPMNSQTLVTNLDPASIPSSGSFGWEPSDLSSGSNCADWLQHSHEHVPGITVVEQRGCSTGAVQMVQTSQDRATSDPATGDLVISMQISGHAKFAVNLGFDSFAVDTKASGNFAVLAAGHSFEVADSEQTEFELLILAIPWGTRRHKAEDLAQRDLSDFGGKLHSDLHRDTTVEHLMHHLWRELAEGQPGGELLAEGLSTAMIGRLIQLSEVPVPSPPKLNRLSKDSLRRVDEYIHEHLSETISLDELSDLAFVSKFHFSRQFKRTTGLTPHQYVVERRIERAKTLLHDPAMSDTGIAAIATACGFTDQSHLGRHFRKLVGVTPATYRKAIG